MRKFALNEFLQKNNKEKNKKFFLKGMRKEKEGRYGIFSSMLEKRQTKVHTGRYCDQEANNYIDEGSNKKRNERKKIITKKSKMAKL